VHQFGRLGKRRRLALRTTVPSVQQMPSTAVRIPLRGAVAAWLVGSAVAASVILPASPAYAACGDTTYTENSQQSTNNRGARSTAMRVSDTDVGCVRVSSVIVWINFDNYAEIGWFEDPDGIVTRCQPTNGHPWLLVYSIVNGNINCKQNPPILSGGVNDSFSTDDRDGDTRWYYYYEGINQGSYLLSFTSGQPITNGERKDQTDSMYSKFQGLDKWRISTNWWWPWNNTQAWTTGHNQDPEYEVCILSDTHTTVELVC
jgi:hypothetical protein